MLPTPHAMLEERNRKLYTLLSLRELGSCSHLQLLYFMAEYNIMTAFDLSLALPELVDEGYAAKISHPTDSLYTITDAGLEALSLFMKHIPLSMTQLITEKAPAWQERFTREKQFISETTVNESGEYTLHLQLVDGAAPMLRIDIPLPEKSLADHMEKQWFRHAGEIYQYLLGTLGGDA